MREAGAIVLCETTVTELVQDAYGKVIGVRTDRDGGEVHADVVVLAEGVNGLLGTRADLRERPTPDNVALAVKEMHFLPRETIEARFNLKGDEGVVIEAAGTISKGMTGMGFIYTNKECISIGIGCLVSDFAEDRRDALRSARIASRSIPSVAPLIDGSEVKEYAAHLIPEGGYNAIPQLCRRRLGRRRRRRPAQQRDASRRLQPGDDLGPARRRGDLPDQVTARSDDRGQSLALQEDDGRLLRDQGSEEVQGYAGAAAYLSRRTSS